MRERRLKLIVAFDQRVIIRIADLGRIVGVIEPRMISDRACETLKFGGGFGFSHAASSSRPACARASSVTSAPDSIRAISSRR